MATHFDEYERWAHALEFVSERLDKDSPELTALERAGWALAFVAMYHQREFEDFLREKDRGKLSPDQVALLRKCGLR